MVAFADTSFLFSIYANDVHTPKALAWLRRHRAPVRTTVLGKYELANALRFAEFRGALEAGSAAVSWSQFEQDRAAGRVLVEALNLAEVVDQADRLSAEHTLTGGHRAFDILHVAAAMVAEAENFLSFDQNQRHLAQAQGLALPV